MDIVLKCFFIFFGAVVIWFGVTSLVYMPFVIGKSRKNYRDGGEYLMILGGDIIGEDIPSPQLFERMKAAADYLKDNTDCVIVPCGGCFRPGQKKSEAEINSSYLVEQGIDRSRIIQEDKSTTTFENFLFAVKIIEEDSGKDISDVNIAFLTSSYHIHRSSVIAKVCGIKNAGKVSCPTPGAAYKRFVREYFVTYDLFGIIFTKKYSNK